MKRNCISQTFGFLVAVGCILGSYPVAITVPCPRFPQCPEKALGRAIQIGIEEI
jgi:hypothetical protein